MKRSKKSGRDQVSGRFLSTSDAKQIARSALVVRENRTGSYVNIHSAKTNLSKLLAQAEKGEEVVIARAGKPVAKLVAYAGEQRPRTPGGLEGAVWVAEDFDEFVPEEMMRAFEGNDT